MAVCDWRTLLLVICFLELVVTVQRQIFDFMGYMWLPIIANFVNIIFIIFGCFGAVQFITKYLVAYSIWCIMWMIWNFFLICYYLNIGSLNRESGLLSLGTGSVSWWESNGWGCQVVWGDVEEASSWRPTRVDGCLLFWPHVELVQSSLAAVLTATALPLVMLQAYRSYKKVASTEKKTLNRPPVYTIELSQTEATVSESSLKPMTPRRVKRRSGSRGTGSSVRRSRRSYRNAGYLASSASLPRDNRHSRPTSAHSSYSNFHGARPASYHVPDVTQSQDMYNPPPPSGSVPVLSTGYDSVSRGATTSPGYDVVGPYNDSSKGYEQNRVYENRDYETKMQIYENRSHGGSNYTNAAQVERMGSPDSRYGVSGYGEMYPSGATGSWEAPPPPAPPYGSRATPQAPGPPAYQPANEPYNVVP